MTDRPNSTEFWSLSGKYWVKWELFDE